jgi:hypothetical protein
MANKVRITHPGKKGTWPGGEPAEVRDAYDAQFQTERNLPVVSQKGKKGAGK